MAFGVASCKVSTREEATAVARRAASISNEHGTLVHRRTNDKQTKKQDPGQFAFNFEFRADTTGEQKADSVSLDRHTAGLLLRRTAANVLGNAIAGEVTKRGPATFVGRKIKSPSA